MRRKRKNVKDIYSDAHFKAACLHIFHSPRLCRLTNVLVEILTIFNIYAIIKIEYVLYKFVNLHNLEPLEASMKSALLTTVNIAQEIDDLLKSFPKKLRIKAVDKELQTLIADLGPAREDPLRVPDVDISPETDELERKLYTKVKDLAQILSVRLRLNLRLNDYIYIGDIVQKQPIDILQCTGIGKVYLKELTFYLDEVGLTFGMKLEAFPNPNVIQRLSGGR